MKSTKTAVVTSGSKTVFAYAGGSAARGYHAIVQSRNGRVIWESSTPWAFPEAASRAALDYAVSL